MGNVLSFDKAKRQRDYDRIAQAEAEKLAAKGDVDRREEILSAGRGPVVPVPDDD